MLSIKAIWNKITRSSQPAGTTVFFGRSKTAGIPVTHENALTYSVIWRCVNLISQSIATMPWYVMQRDQQRRSKTLWNHQAYTLLDLMPNSETDALSFRETLLAWALTWGNGYGEIVRDRSMRPAELWQIEPSRVRPDRDKNGQLWYEITNGSAANSYLRPQDIFHLKGLGFDGLVGYSVIAYAAKTIGLGLATEQFGSNFFANGANAGGVLQHPGKLSDDAIKHLKESLVEGTSGSSSRSPLILEEGMEWNTISVPPDDAQFLETRKFTVAEGARWYGVPLHKLHEMDKSSFNNIEQQAIEFVTDALMPWVKRLEMEANIKLISPAMRGRTYTKLNVNSLLRGDTKARGEWYKTMTTIGAYNVNKVLELEDENPIGPDGDKHLVQMNLTTLEKVGEENTQANENPFTQPGAQPDAPDEENDDEAQETAMAARAILVENAQRIIARCGHRATEALKNHAGDRDALLVYLNNFASDQGEYMRKILSTSVEAFNLQLDLDAFIDQSVDEQTTAILASHDAGEELFHVEPDIMVDQLLEATR